MKTSYVEIETLLKRLPISYYVSRRIPVHLSKKENHTYYVPSQDRIVISYPMIEEALEGTTDDITNKEEVLRGLLYHEISHALLTLANIGEHMANKGIMYNHRAFNIFEDERIETVLRDYYVDVDFKKNLFIITGFKGESPSDAREAYYQLIRFNVGTRYWIRRKYGILNRYFGLKGGVIPVASSSYYYSYYLEGARRGEKDLWISYIREVMSLYNEFIKQWNEDHGITDYEDEDEDKDKGTIIIIGGSGLPEDEGADDDDEEIDASDATVIIISNDGTPPTDEGENVLSPEAQKVLNKVKELIENNTPTIEREDAKQIFDKNVNRYYDDAMKAELERIIREKMKRQNRNGSSITSYSGVFDPRLVAKRDDYRWWTASNRLGHLRRFSKLHINLFIDNSGSFCDNDEQMNVFIQSLARVSDKDFSFDIITINYDIVEWDSPKYIFHSFGGNRVSSDIWDVVKKHQKRDANTYNIVLFDGDAHSNDSYSCYGRENLLAFDTPNTIIISDLENKSYLENAHKARVEFVSNYCEAFIKTILKLMDRVM